MLPNFHNFVKSTDAVLEVPPCIVSIFITIVSAIDEKYADFEKLFCCNSVVLGNKTGSEHLNVLHSLNKHSSPGYDTITVRDFITIEDRYTNTSSAYSYQRYVR